MSEEIGWDGVLRRWRHAERVAAGQTSVRQLPATRQLPLSVGVQPTVGATATIEATLCTPAEIEDGTALWWPWAAGAVTAATLDALLSPVTAVRCRATGGDVDWRVLL